jgi:hypothetical protein
VSGVAVLAAISVLAGCGGNSSLSSGKLVDGYISGATVILDTNDDRICSETEPTTATDASGNFSFSTGWGSHMTCASGGTDLSTGSAFIGVAKAPAGATTISPLTNLVVANIDATLGAPVLGTASAPTTNQPSINRNDHD